MALWHQDHCQRLPTRAGTPFRRTKVVERAETGLALAWWPGRKPSRGWDASAWTEVTLLLDAGQDAPLGEAVLFWGRTEAESWG